MERVFRTFPSGNPCIISPHHHLLRHTSIAEVEQNGLGESCEVSPSSEKGTGGILPADVIFRFGMVD